MGTIEAGKLTWREKAEKLWDLLDKIDTIDDIAKGDDRVYRRMCQDIMKQRFEYAQSLDGYKLTWIK